MIEIFQAQDSFNKARNTVDGLTQDAKKLGINNVETELKKGKEALKEELKSQQQKH